MSDASAASRSDSQGSAKTKAPRSPVERILVWGGILVLLVLVAAQARARMGWQMTVDSLRERVQLDEGTNPQSLLLKDIDQHIVGWPSRTEEKFGRTEQVVTLTWKGLLSTYGVDVRATQDPEPVVLELIPHGAPEPQPPHMAEGPPDDAPSNMMVMPPGGGGGTTGGPPGGHAAAGGQYGGGGGFDPMQQDTDGDGKISREEAQGRFAENFDRNDANADGFVDQEEVAALMERIRNRSAEGGGPGGGRGRPESETPAESGAPEAADPASGTPSESATETEKPAATDDGAGAVEAPPSSTP